MGLCRTIRIGERWRHFFIAASPLQSLAVHSFRHSQPFAAAIGLVHARPDTACQSQFPRACLACCDREPHRDLHPDSLIRIVHHHSRSLWRRRGAAVGRTRLLHRDSEGTSGRLGVATLDGESACCACQTARGAGRREYGVWVEEGLCCSGREVWW